MVYKILFSEHAAKTLLKLPSDIKEKIRLALLRIQVRPFDYLEKLVNHPYYKLRLWDYRIIIDVINEDLVILFVEVGHRRNIYKRFG
ncbi:MAG: type II toxin-antitoxin system RelE/ParE family toxin [Candidatus Heimdallarchaeota archaeon]